MRNYNTVTFFIVAHMDDWQLFMNPYVTWSLWNETNKVIIIYTTSNDAGGGEDYWRAKEEASISSVRFGISHLRDVYGAREIVQINNHALHRWFGGNAICYFLRLPDGHLSGSGFASQSYQSLQKLYQKSIHSIRAVDQSTTYNGWLDFVYTLQGIIDYEVEELTDIIINYPETENIINPGDNSDHRATGLAVQAMPKYPNYRRYSYIGYHLRSYPADLLGEDLFWKIGQFAVYDKTLYDLTGYSTLKEGPSNYIEICFRSAKFREL